jgi:hypothetical protein
VSAGANQRRPRCYHRCYRGAKAFGVVALTRAKAIQIVSPLKDVDAALGTRSARDGISGTSDRKVGTATQRLRGIRRKWMDRLAKASSGRSRPRRFELLVRSRPLPPRAHGCRARA